MASGLTPQQLAAYQQSSNPWEWQQYAATQDPGLYGWNKYGIDESSLSFGPTQQLLKAAGLWRPEFDQYLQAKTQAMGNGDAQGMMPQAPDLSGLAGYQYGDARSIGDNRLQGLFGPDGAMVGDGLVGQTQGFKGRDYLEGIGTALAPIALGAGLGAAGIGPGIGGVFGAGGTATLGTIAPGAAEVGSLGTVGQFTLPTIGSAAAPSAVLAGETAGLGIGQIGALGASGTGVLGSGASLGAPGLGSTALGSTGAASSVPSFAPLASTIGAPAAAGLGEYGAAIKAASSLVGGLGSAYANGTAAQNASQAQQQAAQAGQAQLAPYATAGTGALSAQQDLSGLNGPEKQAAAIAALKAGPEFTAAQDLGERSILANASATGGLRGSNTQAALAQFSPQLLAQIINQQYGRLGSMVGTGLSAAGGVSNLIQQGGAAAAGGALAGGKQQSGYWGALGNAAGLYAGLSGW